MMVPSSSQWTMNTTADILVYPISSYVIDQTAKQPRSAERQRRRSRSDQHTAVKKSARCRREPRARRESVAEHSPAETPPSRSDRRPDSRRRRRSASNSSGSHPLHRHQRRRRRRRRRGRRRGQPAASPSGRSQSPDQLSDRDGDHHADAAHEADEAGARAVRRSRCSANVVLLAHGNRTLYVLAVQRTCNSVVHHGGTAVSTSVRRQRRGTSHAPAKYNYKLPGGQLTTLNGQQEDCDQQNSNTCSCPDDQRWYTAAIEHLETLIQITVPLPRADDGSDTMRGREGAPLPPSYMPLGTWYRTVDKQTRREELSGDATPSAATYYPYKPAHVSGPAAEQKRIYAVPDALGLFRGQQLRLHVPRAKVRTATSPDSVTVTTTTYKCKFVPMARLHENGRLYGPILASLPTVLSSLNLIYLP